MPSEIEFNNLHSISVQLPGDYQKIVETDQTYDSIWRTLHGLKPREQSQGVRVNWVLDQFKLSDNCLVYNNRNCFPRKLVLDLLHSTHDSRFSGRFAFQRTLHRLGPFYWKTKTEDVKNYCAGCLIYQQHMNSHSNPFGTLNLYLLLIPIGVP